MKEHDINYLDEQFPKGDKRRGEAMVLLALARIEGKKEIIEEYEKYLDDYKNAIKEEVEN
jgi:hypothetical protein